MPIIRCCVANYKVEEFENLCHNCSAIFEELHPEIRRQSLRELILEDENFSYPNYREEKMTVQDCWRQKENRVEQNAVRGLKLGGKNGLKMARLLFEPDAVN